MKTFFTVIAIIALAALASALLVEWPKSPDQIPVGGPIQTYPWQIEVSDDGATIRIFDLTLGRDSLADASKRFGEEPKLALFQTEAGAYTAEAYFSRVELGKLLGKVALTLVLDPTDIRAWMERGSEQTISETGSLKVTPSGQDRAAIDRAAISSLAFMPMVRLEPETISLRFGEPEHRYQDANGVQHWAWPARGLDIALHQGRTKDVLQYQSPGSASVQQTRSIAEPLSAPPSAQTTEPGQVVPMKQKEPR